MSNEAVPSLLKSAASFVTYLCLYTPKRKEEKGREEKRREEKRGEEGGEVLFGPLVFEGESRSSRTVACL